ncbi:MAG: hypothetical protein C0P77_009210 [Thermoanaerobacterales bacterium]
MATTDAGRVPTSCPSEVAPDPAAALEQLPPLLGPGAHLLPVVVEQLDHRLRLQEGVAGHGQHAPAVDLHALGAPAPRLGRLGAQGDLQEALEHPLVVDARPHALVVLGVAHDQPGPDDRARVARLRTTAGAGASPGDDGEVGLDRRGVGVVLEADERDGETGDHRGGTVGHGPLVGHRQLLGRRVGGRATVGPEHGDRALQPELPHGRRQQPGDEPLVAHQALERHRPHPTRLGDAGRRVGVTERPGELPPVPAGDQRIGVAVALGPRVRRGRDGAAAAAGGQ